MYDRKINSHSLYLPTKKIVIVHYKPKLILKFDYCPWKHFAFDYYSIIKCITTKTTLFLALHS